MDIVLIVVGVMLAVALIAAAGGFRARSRRGVVVERPVRRRAPVVTEEVVERRIRE